MSRSRIRLVLFGALAVLLGFVLVDVLGLRPTERGVISPKGYVGIPHGSHSHYVPNGWDGEPEIGAFPTSPPPEGMTVSETGEVVPFEGL